MSAFALQWRPGVLPDDWLVAKVVEYAEAFLRPAPLFAARPALPASTTTTALVSTGARGGRLGLAKGQLYTKGVSERRVPYCIVAGARFSGLLRAE